MLKIECISLATRRPIPIPSSSVICLGNFDGVHLAHREILRASRKLQQERFPSAACAVLCFRAPSADYLFAQPPSHLTTLEQKLDCFLEEGIDCVFLIDFPEIKELSPLQFFKTILKESCHAAALVCGFNYRFGKNGEGTAETLQAFSDTPVITQPEILYKGATVSSTRIRALLTDGKAEEAAELLTKPYGFSAEIVHGKALGEKLGTPTINQYFPTRLLIPRHGVYVTDCEIDGIHYRGVSNVGNHPTVDRNACVNCETYLLDFSGDLYGKTAKISFLKFLRPEMKFENVKDLQARIKTDIESAKAYQV